jgi:hypothetical protein
MDGIAASRKRCAHDHWNVEVAFLARTRANTDGSVSQSRRERGAIRLGVRENGLDSKLTTCPDDPHSDFAAIGDEYAAEHQPITIPPSTWITCPVM